MADLIDRDALFKAFEKVAWYNNADRDEIAEEILLQMPTIDAKPVVHGKWDSEYMFDDWNGNRVYEHRHLECGHRHRNYLDKEAANFCPNCGADMRGET